MNGIDSDDSCMQRHAVLTEGLTFHYGARPALDGVDVRVPETSLYGLLGPNGGGKTTLLRILATLLKPDAGSARVMELDTVTAAASVRRQLGIVFQDTALDDELSLSENLHTHGALYGLSRSFIQDRLAALLPLFGLAGRESDRVATFSGGLKRRADIVRGLLHAPPLLLLDEPTTGLDPRARHVFWEIIERLRRKESTTLLVATHMMEEADRCDHLAIIDEGRVVAEGSPDALKAGVGAETLWLEADEPAPLAERIRTHFNLEARLIGSRIQISGPDAHSVLGMLYEHYGDDIRSATVRRPTLEDVFMVHAGHGLEEPSEGGTVALSS